MNRKHSLFAIVILAMAVVAAAPATAQYLEITGSPLRVAVNGTGQMGAWNNGVNQYFGEYQFGSVLLVNGGAQKFSSQFYTCSGGSNFTAVSNTKPDDWHIVTVYEAGATGIRITQDTVYANGQQYFQKNWTITNTGSTTYTDLRLLHGGDTYFGGDDSSEGHWNAALGMVYLTNPNPAIDGIMGFYGAADTPAARYYEDGYSSNYTQMCNGWLANTVNPSFLDAGYSLQWNRASLAPGESWVIHAFEKWTSAGFVQVFAPANQDALPGETLAYQFVVQNYQEVADTFDLSASSSTGWTVGLGSSSVVIGAGASANVSVQLTVPPTATPGQTDVLTLTATSQSNPSVTNLDRVTTTIATPSGQTLSVAVTGNGSVASDPAGISCGATCSALFPAGSTVQLSASPAAGWAFSAWSGACAGSGACSVTMSAPAEVGAVFVELPQISISDAQLAEGHAGSAGAVLTVSLSAPSESTVTVTAASADLTAAAGADYQALAPVVVTFAPSQLSATVSVPVLGDTSAEGNETFAVDLSSPSNAVIGDGRGIVTILDDDADLAVSFFEDETSAVPGTAAAWRFRAANNGLVAVAGARIAAQLPAVLSGASWTCTAGPGASCASGSGAVDDTANLPAGGWAEYAVAGTVDPAALGSIEVGATIAPPAGINDPQTGNDAAADADELTPSANLYLAMSGPAGTPVGKGLLIQAVATNDGPSDAVGVTLTAELPEGLAMVSVGPAPNCQPTHSGVACTLDRLAAGSQATAEITCRVEAAGSLPVTAVVSSATADPQPASNAATFRVNEAAGADVALNANRYPKAAAFGEDLVFGFDVANLSADAAPGLTLTATLPSGAVFSRFSGALACSQAGGSVVCDLGSLDPFGTGEVSLTFSVSDPCTDARSAFEIVSSVSDPRPENNAFTALTPLHAEARIDDVMHLVDPDGTTWRTALDLVNPWPETVAAQLTYQTPGRQASAQVTLRSGQLIAWDDVLLQAFDWNVQDLSSIGTLSIVSDLPLARVARTWSDQAERPSAPAAPDPEPQPGVVPGQLGIIPLPFSTPASSTFIDLVATGGSPATAQLAWYDDSGAPYGQPRIVALEAGEWARIDGIDSTGSRPPAYATLEVLGGSGVWAVATLALLEDEFSIPVSLVGADPYEQTFEGVGHGPHYRKPSGLILVNPGDSEGKVLVSVETQGSTGLLEVLLPAHAARDWDDILAAFELPTGFAGTAALRVSSDGPLVAHVYRRAIEEILSPVTPPEVEEELVRTGEMAVMAGLRNTTAFSSGLGAVNVGEEPMILNVVLRDAAGAVVGEPHSLAAKPGEVVEIRDLFESTRNFGLTEAYATIEATSTDALFQPYSIVFDRLTENPTTLPPTVVRGCHVR